ncbi:hypothetical protein SAMN04488008_104352 [Maribacter orientalis]|uniref:Membrane or secreted protein n=1 Tax=Maribacter orientalis TaxID=228957 RepID=A0A1H7RNU8_9FLAO|nr:hypothetical protein [Maribacter orientalis]SEL61970.1 hypothetical protein SAMN04488008_104352 [Maribacter orientalis]
MKEKRNYTVLSYSKLILLFFTSNFMAIGQISEGIYVDSLENNSSKRIHQVKIHDDYFIYTAYENDPANFIKTLGGFAKIEKTDANTLLVVLLEFNSNYPQDSIRKLSIPVKMIGDKLQLNWFEELTLEPIETKTQDLDGEWLFATRGPDTGQDRRGEESSRKTLKFLKDGTFQWIAFDTESFRFSGTGGGSYTSKDGIYTEHIEFFSKDNSRVGATLEFNYELNKNDWYHTGNNSKGEPLYEIWAKRK